MVRIERNHHCRRTDDHHHVSLSSIGLLHTAITREPIPGRTSNEAGLLIFAALLFSPLLVAASWALLKDSFSFTHYPLRFDRKNRIVHVLRKNGTVLSTPWNTVFFTLGQVDQVYKFWNILGHVMADDKQTVIETFSLGASSSGTPEDLEILRAHWELIRRYMEDGPESVMDRVQICLPIKHSYETVGFGMRRLLANGTGLKSLSPAMGIEYGDCCADAALPRLRHAHQQNSALAGRNRGIVANFRQRSLCDSWLFHREPDMSVPWSDRSSRCLIYQSARQSRRRKR